MSSNDARQAIEAFHNWRRQLLLPGSEAGTDAPDPELVLSSKMLRVFAKLHPELAKHLVSLQLHFLEQDYTNRVKPNEWLQESKNAELAKGSD